MKALLPQLEALRDLLALMDKTAIWECTRNVIDACTVGNRQSYGTYSHTLRRYAPKITLGIQEGLQQGSPTTALQTARRLWRFLSEPVDAEARAELEQLGKALTDQMNAGKPIRTQLDALATWSRRHGPRLEKAILRCAPGTL